MDNLHNLPSFFCWTKIGTEAGQPLSVILARKEAERKLGQGIFFWGIGNALGLRVWEFVDHTPRPRVIFTTIRGKPRLGDVSPNRVVAWTAFLDRWGIKQPIPPHAFVTSRADTEKGVDQSRFALVCKCEHNLEQAVNVEPVCSGKVANFRTKTEVAPSQVTAIVEVKSSDCLPGRMYDVFFMAELVAPYYVKLADPVDIPLSVLAEINEVPLLPGFNSEKWKALIDKIYGCRKCLPTQIGLFPAGSSGCWSSQNKKGQRRK